MDPQASCPHLTSQGRSQNTSFRARHSSGSASPPPGLKMSSTVCRLGFEVVETPVANGMGRLKLLPELIAYALEFLDGRSLTSFETASAGTRRALQQHPGLYKHLLLQQLENVPQLASLRNKDGKQALIAWNDGEFQPTVAVRSSKMAPSPRYLHRVALAADGWYYLHGGHLSMGMCGEVWRFRVEESRGPRRSFTGGVVMIVGWELVDAERLPDTAADGDANSRASDANTGGPHEDAAASDGNGRTSDYTDTRSTESEVSDVGRIFGSSNGSENDDDEGDIDGTLNPAALFNLPPAAQNAQHGAWQALAAAAAQGAGGGAQGHAHAAHAAFQAALWAQQPAFEGDGGVNPVALDANGQPVRPTPRCAVSWTSMPGTNKIYLFGGLGQTEDFMSDLWCFHAGTRGECRWERLKTARQVGDVGEELGGGGPGAIPSGRWGHTMVEFEGALYMFGGSSPGQAYTGLWRLDASVRPCRWSLLAQEGEQPPPRGGHSATVSVFNDMWAINLRSCNTWRQIPHTPNFPLARIGHSAVAMGNRILIYGGRNFLTERYPAGLSCFDTELQAFVSFQHSEAFARRSSHVGGMWYGLRMTGHAAVPCSRGLLFVGGLVPRGHSTMSAWVLDTVGGRRRLAKKRSRRRARAIVSAGGCWQS